MSKQKLIKQDVPFTMIANKVINNSELSLKAIGLFAYMYSKPNNWNFTINSMATQMRDGKDSIRNAMVELKENGYLEYVKNQDGTGIYHISYEPKSEKPDLGIPTVGKSERINNTDCSKKKECSAIYDSFESLWLNYKTYRKKYNLANHGVKGKTSKKYIQVHTAIMKRYKKDDITEVQAVEAIESYADSRVNKEFTPYLQNILEIDTVLDWIKENLDE